MRRTLLRRPAPRLHKCGPPLPNVGVVLDVVGSDYLVRQLNDHKATLDVTHLDEAALQQYAEVCGELLARGHARSGDPGLIQGYIGKGKRFREAMLEFAHAYAAQSRDDWQTFKASLA